MIKVTVGNNVSRQNIIIDENTTLKEVLEQAGVDYTRGSITLDGATVMAGGLNKTFAEYGVTESCYLLNVAKADNAAKVVVVGNAMVITSTLPLEAIKTVAKYRPNELVLFGGEDGKEAVFAIGVGTESIGKYGIGFEAAARTEGKEAQITICLPDGIEDVKEYISDTYGTALVSLEKLEEKLPGIIEEINAEKARIQENIEIAQ